MLVHQTYAQIFKNEVKNIIVADDYHIANWVTEAAYGEEALAVDITQIPCGIGDAYHDNNFYRVDPDTGEEERIVPLPTQEQQVQKLVSENEELTIVMADMIGGVYSA